MAVDALPAEPFALDDQRLAVVASVADPAAAAAVLFAAARGVAVAVALDLPSSEADDFLDDLSRVATLDDQFASPTVAVGDEHARLLAELAAGATLTEAARRLGWSRRTATRRLHEARDRLGAATTAEAIATFRTP